MRIDAKFFRTKILFPIDEFVALLLTLCLMALVVLVWAVRLPWTRNRVVCPNKVLLFSYEGHKVAPTRVRCYHFAEVLRRQGVDAEVFAYWDEYARLAHFPFPFRRIWEVEKFCINLVTLMKLLPKGPMVIMEQRPNYDFIVPLALKLLNGSRVVMDIDDWTLSYRAFVAFYRFEVRHMLPFFALYCDTCIVSSRCLQERLGRHFKHVPLLPTYVDHERFTPAPDSEQHGGGPVVFSWVGTIFQNFTHDNVMFMVEAFKRACDLLGTREGLALDIVGGGDYFEKVCTQVREHYAGYAVRVIPWVAPEKMPAYLQSIDVGLYCLVEQSLFHESKSPTKIFEYYACAKPVVSTRVGEAKYFVIHGETGYLAADVQEFAQGMVHMLEDPDKRRAMGLAGLRLAQNRWNMDEACRTLAGILLHGCSSDDRADSPESRSHGSHGETRSPAPQGRLCPETATHLATNATKEN